MNETPFQRGDAVTVYDPDGSLRAYHDQDGKVYAVLPTTPPTYDVSLDSGAMLGSVPHEKLVLA